MRNWRKVLSNFLLIVGALLIIAGVGVWAWQTVWPELRFRSIDDNGDGVVLAAKLDTSETTTSDASESDGAGALKPTFTPVPTDTAAPTASPTRQASRTPAASLTATNTPAPTATSTPTGPTPASQPPSRLVIPSISLDADVVKMGWEVKQTANGDTYSEWIVPDYAAGWHKNSALPGRGGNTVLSGHHNIQGEVFRYIVDTEPGDDVTLYADGNTYEYIVTEKYIVKEKGVPYEQRLKNAELINETDDERLTLVSCWPYETNTHRVIVIARPLAEVQGMQGNLQ